MKAIFRECATRLARGEDLVLATIVRKTGSAPRSDGSRMLVRADGSSLGSVGGGRLEAETLALAREVFRTRVPVLQRFDLAGADAAGADMICGGRGEILVDFLAAGTADAEVFARAVATLESRRRGGLVTWLPPAGAAPAPGTHRGIACDDGTSLGRVPDAARLAAPRATEPGSRAIRVERVGEETVVIEPLFSSGRVLVFGAGHCAQRLAPMAQSMDFDVEVVDDRDEFANRERYPEPTGLTLIESFERLPDLAIDDDTYVVIMTRGHLHDLTVLAQCLRAPAGYVGMIGSVRKRDKVYAELRERGFGDADFARVYSPIGLEIEAETPEEIAVSIVAELIRVRAARAGRGGRRGA